MRVAILGCGYVANMYRLTFPADSGLEIAGVFDRERARASSMARLTGAIEYASFEALLDDNVDLVLNLTNPRSHHETTRALLESGKHVFSEKPLTTRLDDARELVDLAERRGLLLSSAPCTLLNPVAQTVWRRLRENAVGPVRLVYAEMEDGMVPRAPTAKWINEAGVGWPVIDEFESGCTMEHAGYVLSWLCAFFGPAESLTAYSDILQPDKIPGLDIAQAPDFSVACIKFRSGVVARMTNGIYATHDHRMTFFGDDGILSVNDPRNDTSAIRERLYYTLRRRRTLGPARKIRLLGERERIATYRGSQSRDFWRAVVDMAHAIEEGRPAYLSARLALHVTELTLACQSGGALGGVTGMPNSGLYIPETDFEPMEPLSWAL